MNAEQGPLHALASWAPRWRLRAPEGCHGRHGLRSWRGPSDTGRHSVSRVVSRPQGTLSSLLVARGDLHPGGAHAAGSGGCPCGQPWSPTSVDALRLGRLPGAREDQRWPRAPPSLPRVPGGKQLLRAGQVWRVWRHQYEQGVDRSPRETASWGTHRPVLPARLPLLPLGHLTVARSPEGQGPSSQHRVALRGPERVSALGLAGALG